MDKQFKLSPFDQATHRNQQSGIKTHDEHWHPNHSHAWRGSWNRPMNIDEDSHHPFTVARMTDHNVRGGEDVSDERSILQSSQRDRTDEPNQTAA
jgi:hypothetical protein